MSKRAELWMGVLVVVAVAAAGACRGKTTTSPLQKLKPAGTAIAPEALGFLTELPASTIAFGVIDLHQPLQLTVDKIVSNAPWLGPLVADVKAMTERRFGLNPLSSRALGVAGIEVSGDASIDAKVDGVAGSNSEQAGKPRKSDIAMFGIFQAAGNPSAAFAPVADLPGAFRSANVVLYKMGAYWAIGDIEAIRVLNDARKLPARFLTTKTDFIRWAWAKAGGEFMMAIEVPASAKDKSGAAEKLSRAMFTAQTKTDGSVQRFELQAQLQGRPGQHDAMQAEVVEAVAAARAKVDAKIAELESAQPAVAALAKHYVTALNKSLTVTTGQNETAIVFGGRLPTLPAFGAAPSMQNRVAAVGESAVVQFNAGGPLLDALIAATDIFAQPLDRAAVNADLLHLLPPGAPVGISSIVASIGGPSTFVFSATTANPVQLQPQHQSLQWGSTFIENKATPWGMALSFGGPASDDQPTTMDPRLDKPSATVILRGAVDVSKLPAQLQTKVGGWVRSAFFEIGTSRALLEVQAVKGQGKVLMGFLDVGKQQLLSQVEPPYAQRTSFEDPTQELGAIVAYHWTKFLIATVAPKLVGDDLLRIDLQLNDSTIPLTAGLGIGTAVVGMLTAIAIPAFTDYLKKGKQSEAQLILNRIKANQRVGYITNASYVVGS